MEIWLVYGIVRNWPHYLTQKVSVHYFGLFLACCLLRHGVQYNFIIIHAETRRRSVEVGASRMHETSKFPLPVYSLTSSSCSLTLISFKTQKYQQFDDK